MKSEKPARSRPKLSFAVDRDDIDTSTSWVDAVVAVPASAQPTSAPRTSVVARSFFAPKQDSATVESPTTGAASATEAKKATEAQKATGALFEEPNSATVASGATVDGRYPVSEVHTRPIRLPKRPYTATVGNSSTVIQDATVALFQAGARALRLRPIQRVTDGLTPGQFAVYRLMFEQGEPGPEQQRRLYRGGYVDLCRLTGLSKRGIQNAVAELLRKSVLSIHQAPGYHRTQTTVYQVPAEDLVLMTWFGMGFRYAVGKSKTLVNLATVANNPTV